MFLCDFFKGVDTWIRLHVRIMIMLPRFNRTTTACRKKHNNLFKAYEEDKMTNGILRNVCYESNFFDAMDEW